MKQNLLPTLIPIPLTLIRTRTLAQILLADQILRRTLDPVVDGLLHHHKIVAREKIPSLRLLVHDGLRHRLLDEGTTDSEGTETATSRVGTLLQGDVTAAQIEMNGIVARLIHHLISHVTTPVVYHHGPPALLHSEERISVAEMAEKSEVTMIENAQMIIGVRTSLGIEIKIGIGTTIGPDGEALPEKGTTVVILGVEFWTDAIVL